MVLWKTLSKRVILDHSPFLKVEEHSIELPDGRVIPDWSWVITPDFVNVIAVTENQKILCFHQVKYGVEGTTLAPVGGHIDHEEKPLDAAQRELLEETGYVSSNWTELGNYRVGANRGFATAHFFLARGARYQQAPTDDDLEEQELLHLSRAEMERALNQCKFKVVSWVAAITLALRCLQQSDESLTEQ